MIAHAHALRPHENTLIGVELQGPGKNKHLCLPLVN